MTLVTPEKRAHLSTIARLGGLARSARYDGTEMTARARKTLAASFRYGHNCSVCPPVLIPVDLPLTERLRRGQALRTAHYTRIGRKGGMS